jgi:hypothetical protein
LLTIASALDRHVRGDSLRHPSERVQGHLPALIERAARRIGARPPGGSFASLYGADPTMASIPI